MTDYEALGNFMEGDNSDDAFAFAQKGHGYKWKFLERALGEILSEAVFAFYKRRKLMRIHECGNEDFAFYLDCPVCFDISEAPAGKLWKRAIDINSTRRMLKHGQRSSGVQSARRGIYGM